MRIAPLSLILVLVGFIMPVAGRITAAVARPEGGSGLLTAGAILIPGRVIANAPSQIADRFDDVLSRLPKEPNSDGRGGQNHNRTNTSTGT